MASKRKTVVVALVIAAIMMMATVLALLTSIKTIPTSGTISAFKVGVYTDANYNVTLDSITFGTISAGYNTTKTIYIKNDAVTGGKSMSLSMNIPAWACDPANTTENVVYITFDSTGTVLAPTESCTATIMLIALDNNSTRAGLTFANMNIEIIGTEV